MGKESLFRSVRWWLPLAALLLHGCSVLTVPGYDFTDPDMDGVVGTDEPTADGVPRAVITPITPALLKAQRASESRAIPPEVQQLFAQGKPYTIGPSDIISIIVYDHPELQPQGGAFISQSADPTAVAGAPGFIVDDGGFIYYPYARRVKVGGLTETQAAELIESRIKHIIKDPQVTVRIAAFRSRRAYVDGEVRSPGPQIFTDVPMTLSEALNRAGGITPTGDRSFVTVTRNERTTVLDLMKMQDLGISPTRILLEPNDLVTVRSRDDSKVFVMGEIARPSALQMRNGRLSLNEALGEAGGPNLGTSNTGQIYVIRNVPGQDEPAIFHLNASNPTSLALAENFPLRPRDVVFVDAVPLVQWNRVISLILPSAQAALTGRSLVNP
jgi:polysaccharide export outer membrane protein